jgi:hypothetical protein
MSRLFHHRAMAAHWIAALAILGIFSLGAAARAEDRVPAKLDALYTATLAGIPLGKGAWVIEIGDDQYTAVTSGVTTGLLRVFASGQGSGIARGYVSNGVLTPASYAATITADKKTEELRMVLAAGVVKDLSITPTPPVHPERIPVTDGHRRGVTDPMTASLVRVGGNGDVIAPETCQRSTPVFDGRMRYDLTMAYKRIEAVKADKGYAGPAVVCAIYFRPVAGYVPNRPAIKYLAEQRDMEVWLVPVAGTRIVVPFRIAIPTPLGTGALQATQFIATPQSPRLTPTSLKAQ